MQRRAFGKTGFQVSVIGFGAWGIGGPAMVHDIPIGWGRVDDATSERALRWAFELGVNFYDTADFYGLGHSEELIGKVFGNRDDVIIATKIGNRIGDDGNPAVDYSKKYMLAACEASLKRLRRDRIDYYQLHSARLPHLESGECIEVMEDLKRLGKIRAWGLSVSTYRADPEADFLIDHGLGDGLQLVLNIMNQRAVRVMKKAAEHGYGIIARMPLQFGLLTGKFTKSTRFEKNDHRSFRMTPDILALALDALEGAWPLAVKYGISKTSLALSFIASFDEVSTIIPGIKTPEQAEANTKDILKLSDEDMAFLRKLFNEKLCRVVERMEKQG
ncbi:MAG: aldo/keto reductase [Ignavibacteriales bacterium CG07_land_8_20_14_0_80_59_12]|nr:MAG: aldo/keto reductase [Ignavibacteriales bacterium CG07_land_8_20_14_0_80_59_12]